MSDEELLKLSYKNPHRFSELFDRHNRRFTAIAKKTLRSSDDAEDVVQEVFVRIYKYGKKFPSNGGKFRSWSNTILKNCIADQINKYKNLPVSLTDEMEETTPDLSLNQQYDDGSELFENKSYVQLVLKKIDSAAAEMINLRYILGKSFKEISKVLGIKNSTARVRVYRSKKIFAEAYRQFNNNYYE